ncbi:MAG: hypothetical protein LBR17_08405 [Bacteroidales bacterium]|jgi:hypothetical protein|nr:hypothetical protein [Bacteroidales bacterium]
MAYEEIIPLINEVRTETDPAGNTKVRIADAMLAILNYLQDTSNASIAKANLPVSITSISIDTSNLDNPLLTFTIKNNNTGGSNNVQLEFPFMQRILDVEGSKIDKYQISQNINDDDDKAVPSSHVTYMLNELITTLQSTVATLTNRVDASEGKGGYLTGRDFGSATPTQEDLTRYACEDIWGSGGTWTLNESSPAQSTYVINGTTHTASEIFNSTRVVNTYDATDPGKGTDEWALSNTPDTNPAVFIWVLKGSSYVSAATNVSQGIVSGQADTSTNDGGLTFDTPGIARVIGFQSVKTAANNALAKTEQLIGLNTEQTNEADAYEYSGANPTILTIYT